MNLIVLIVLTFTLNLSSQLGSITFYKSEPNVCAHCKIEIVRKTESRIGVLRKSEIEKFLCSMDEECKVNTEYSEYSNDVLFKIVEQQTADFFQVFNNLPKGNRSYILFNLSHPIKDYKIKSISEKLKTIVGPADIKEAVLKAITEGAEH
jgi:hypothetical protein